MESEKTDEKNYYQTYKIKSNKDNIYDLEIFINDDEELVFYTTKYEGKIRIEFIKNCSYEMLKDIKQFRSAENNYEIFDLINEIIDYSNLKNNLPFIEEFTNLLILNIPSKNILIEIDEKEKSEHELIEDLNIKIKDLEDFDKNKEKKIDDILNIINEMKNRLEKKESEIEELKNNFKQEKNNYEIENNKKIEDIYKKIKEISDKIEKINKKISEFDLKFIEINSKIINYDKNSESNQKLYNKKIDDINKKNEDLNNKIIENNNYFKKIVEENNKKINDINNKTIKFEDFQNEISNNLEEYKSEQETLTEDLELLQPKVDNIEKYKNNQDLLTKEIQTLQSNINNLTDFENNQDFLIQEIETIQTNVAKISTTLKNNQNNSNTNTLILPSSNPMNNLLKSLIEKKYIHTQRVLNCMLQVDRKDFINVNPYQDSPQLVSHNVTISAPHMHAFALEYLAPFLTEGINVLDIGSGTGYL